MYEKIFNKEAELRELFDEEKITEEQFLERRQQEVKPLFVNLYEWLLKKKNREILETSKTKQAINYCLNRWEKLLPWNIEITPFQPRGEWKND